MIATQKTKWEIFRNNTSAIAFVLTQVTPAYVFGAGESDVGKYLSLAKPEQHYENSAEEYTVNAMLFQIPELFSHSSSIPYTSFDMKILSEYLTHIPQDQISVLEELIGTFSLSGEEEPEDFNAPDYDV